jgi:PAS domain S-box-containing protein
MAINKENKTIKEENLKLIITAKELARVAVEKEKVRLELIVTAKQLAKAAVEKEHKRLKLVKFANSLALANKKKEKENLRLIIVAREFAKIAVEKEKVRLELIVTAKQLAKAAVEKEHSRLELVITAKDIAKAVVEKEKVRLELVLAVKKLAIAVSQKEKSGLKLIISNKELVTAIEEKAEESLLFRSVFHNTAIGMSLVSMNGKWLDVNDKLCKITGYSKKELIESEFINITHPDDVKKSAESLKLLATGKLKFTNLEKRYIHKNGTIIWVLLSISLVKRSKGAQPYFIVSTQDITDRKNIEDKILKSNRALRILSSSNQALVYATGETALLKNVCSILSTIGKYKTVWIGYKENDIEKTIKPVMYEGSDVKYLIALRPTWSEGKNGNLPAGIAVRTGKEFILQDASKSTLSEEWNKLARKYHYKSVVSFPLRENGNIFGALTILGEEINIFSAEEVNILKELSLDLSFGISVLRLRKKQQEDEQRLEDTEKKYETIIEEGNDGIIVAQNFITKFANKKMLEMMGYSMKEIQERPFLHFVDPAFIELAKENYEKRYNGVVFEQTYRLKLIKKNGEGFWAEISGSLIDYDGKSADMIFVRDVTEHVKIEQELREKTESLEEAEKVALLGSYVFDITGGVWTSSAIMNRIFGIDEKYVKSYVGWLGLIHPEDQKMMSDYFKNDVLGEHKFFDKEYRIIRKNDKAVRWVHGLGRLVFNNKKELVKMFGAIQDITVKKQAEEELSKYKFIIDESNQEIGIATLDGYLTFVNKSLARSHGYEMEELLGKHVSILHPKEEDVKVKNDFKILILAGKHSFEIAQLRKDGSTYDGLMNNFLLDLGGNKKIIVGMAANISRLKASEREILQEKSLLDSIVKSTKEGLLVINSEGKIVFYNDKFKILWKVPANIIEAKDDKKLLDFIAGQLLDPKEFLDKVNYLYSHPIQDDVSIVRFKDGRIFNRISVPQKIGDNIIGRIWSFIDITQEQKDDQIIKDSEERYARTIEATNSLVHDLDIATDKVIWRGNTDDLLGYSYEEFINKASTMDETFSMVRPEDATSARKLIDLARANKTEFSVRYRIQKKNGEYVWVQDAGRFIYNAKGEAYRMLGVITDISEIMMLDESKSEFLSIASHQLRTPLSASKWLLESLNSDKELSEKQKQKLNDLNISNERLIGLVNDLLTASKIDAGKVDVNKSFVDVKRLMQGLLADAQSLMAKNKKEVEIVVPEDIKTIYCDQLLTHQIIENLLVNAINYSPSSAPKIKVEIKKRPADYLISVHNGGVIDESLNNKNIFDKFVRGKNSSKIDTSGSGLGLYITKKIVEAKGGSIWYESDANNGTTFYFTVPFK